MHKIIKLFPNYHSSPALFSKSCKRKQGDPASCTWSVQARNQRDLGDVLSFDLFGRRTVAILRV